MNGTKREWLRPSALPKLARCGQFRGDPVGSVYAERGTRMDAWFRYAFTAGVFDDIEAPKSPLEEDEHEAVNWAVDTARALSGSAFIEARESELRIEAEGMTGTADLLCETLGWSADLKSGMKGDYRSQQAAYALGFMERYFVDEWTVYLLYCDEREVETLRFTRESATEAIHDALALYHGGVPPVANEFCGYCVNRFDCPARRESLGIIPEFQAIMFEQADSARLVNFVRAAKVVEEYSEKARQEVLARMLKGEKIPGVTLAKNGKTTRTVANEHIAKHADKIPVADLVAAIGSLSANKAQGLLREHFDESMVTESHGSAYVTIRKK